MEYTVTSWRINTCYGEIIFRLTVTDIVIYIFLTCLQHHDTANLSLQEIESLKNDKLYLRVCYMEWLWIKATLRWRHNDHAGVSNHQPHGCLLNRLFRRKSKKTSKLRVTGLCAGNSPGTGEFPAQMASYAENVSIWWRHHDPTADIKIFIISCGYFSDKD